MLKIILADNQAIFRTGAAKVLAVEDDLRIVAQAENTEKMMMASFRPSWPAAYSASGNPRLPELGKERDGR